MAQMVTVYEPGDKIFTMIRGQVTEWIVDEHGQVVKE